MPKVLREHVASPGVILVGLIEPEHQTTAVGSGELDQGTNTLIGHFALDAAANEIAALIRNFVPAPY
jgi:hypothetical protein